MPFIFGFLARLLPTFFVALSAFLKGFIIAFVAWFAPALLKFFSNTARVMLVFAAIALAFSVFTAAIDYAFSSIANLAPGSWAEVGRAFIPSNISSCISILLLLRLKSLVFYWIVRISEKFERS